MTYRYKIELATELEESLRAYIATGRPTGGFLRACLSNDLSGACARADEANLIQIPVIVAFLVNKAPASCWGSPQRVDDWLTTKQQEFRQKLKGAT